MSSPPRTDDADTSVAPTGHFRIYLGAAAGVGKTRSMLDEGCRRSERGTDVVVAVVETHGRPHTAEAIRNLEVMPRKLVTYRGSTFTEMDVEAVLARRPEVALVDELAHTNVPGIGRNAKRWQDVMELLSNGIQVVTTLNIQHVESLADAVELITGTSVRERVPDWVVRRADQVELVDSSPEQLRRRIFHGNVYPPAKIDDALAHFFRVENLTALRELALRFLADETEEDLLSYLQLHHPSPAWETTERILVGVTGARGTDAVLRRAARMAARSKAELHVVHVSSGEPLKASATLALDESKTACEGIGATWEEIISDDVARALVEVARNRQVTQIVLGASRRNRWEELTQGSVIQRILRAAAAGEVDVHVIARRSLPSETEPSQDSRLL